MRILRTTGLLWLALCAAAGAEEQPPASPSGVAVETSSESAPTDTGRTWTRERTATRTENGYDEILLTVRVA